MLDFSFLSHRAGFAILQTLLPYSQTSSYGRAFLIGLANTLACCALALPLALLVGVIIASLRLSTARVPRIFGAVYVNMFRNIPLLLWILLFYKVPLALLPVPRESITLFWHTVYLNKRGFYVPWLHSWPQQGMYNIEGGLCLLPEFWAPALALALYTAAFMAENLRGGVLSVSPALADAGQALGMAQRAVKRYIVYPLALRSAMPSMIGQSLNLLKNSSLAAAVGYPELMQLMAGTALNQTGRAVELILIVGGTYLFFSVLISKTATHFASR